MADTTESSDEEVSLRFETVLVQQVGGAPEDEGRRILVDGRLLLGRDNPIFAERYPEVSRQHAEVVAE